MNATAGSRGRHDWEQRDGKLTESLMPYIYSLLRPAKENGIDMSQIEILLEHFCPIKYNEWNVRDALPRMLRNHQYPRVCSHYKLGYYLLKYGESEYDD